MSRARPKPKPRATKQLAPLVERLLTTEGIDPNSGTADGPGPDMKPYVVVSELGAAIAPNLAEYVALEDHAFLRNVSAIAVHRGERFFFHPVRTPSRVLFAQNRSLLVTFLAGCLPIAHDPDSNALLIADWYSGAIASFLFDDVVDWDDPGDFYIAAKSITELLESPKRPKPFAAGKELARRYRRGIWLARLFHRTAGNDIAIDEFDGRSELGRIEDNAQDAATMDDYKRERARIATQPDLAAYWLLSHAVLGATGALAETLALSRKLKHPAIVDLRAQLAPITNDVPALAKLFKKHRKDWPAAELAALITTITAHVGR